MKLNNALLSAGFIGIMAASSPAAFAAAQVASAKTGVVAADDKTLAARIEAAMKKDTSLTNQSVDVDVDKGVATLTGSVRSQTRRLRAGRLAHIAGVSRVDNQLTVDANAGKGVMAKTGQVTKEAAHDVAHGAKIVGEKTADAVVATGGAMNSAMTTTKISSNFVDEALLKGSDINVDTTDHEVTLKGTVTSAEGSARAEAIARGTDGVTSVVNELVISAAK